MSSQPQKDQRVEGFPSPPPQYQRMNHAMSPLSDSARKASETPTRRQEVSVSSTQQPSKFPATRRVAPPTPIDQPFEDANSGETPNHKQQHRIARYPSPIGSMNLSPNNFNNDRNDGNQMPPNYFNNNRDRNNRAHSVGRRAKDAETNRTQPISSVQPTIAVERRENPVRTRSSSNVRLLMPPSYKSKSAGNAFETNLPPNYQGHKMKQVNNNYPNCDVRLLPQVIAVLDSSFIYNGGIGAIEWLLSLNNNSHGESDTNPPSASSSDNLLPPPRVFISIPSTVLKEIQYAAEKPNHKAHEKALSLLPTVTSFYQQQEEIAAAAAPLLSRANNLMSPGGKQQLCGTVTPTTVFGSVLLRASNTILDIVRLNRSRSQSRSRSCSPSQAQSGGENNNGLAINNSTPLRRPSPAPPRSSHDDHIRKYAAEIRNLCEEIFAASPTDAERVENIQQLRKPTVVLLTNDVNMKASASFELNACVFNSWEFKGPVENFLNYSTSKDGRDQKEGEVNEDEGRLHIVLIPACCALYNMAASDSLSALRNDGDAKRRGGSRSPSPQSRFPKNSPLLEKRGKYPSKDQPFTVEIIVSNSVLAVVDANKEPPANAADGDDWTTYLKINKWAQTVQEKNVSACGGQLAVSSQLYGNACYEASEAGNEAVDHPDQAAVNATDNGLDSLQIGVEDTQFSVFVHTIASAIYQSKNSPDGNTNNNRRNTCVVALVDSESTKASLKSEEKIRNALAKHEPHKFKYPPPAQVGATGYLFICDTPALEDDSGKALFELPLSSRIFWSHVRDQIPEIFTQKSPTKDCVKKSSNSFPPPPPDAFRRNLNAGPLLRVSSDVNESPLVALTPIDLLPIPTQTTTTRVGTEPPFDRPTTAAPLLVNSQVGLEPAAASWEEDEDRKAFATWLASLSPVNSQTDPLPLFVANGIFTLSDLQAKLQESAQFLQQPAFDSLSSLQRVRIRKQAVMEAQNGV